MLHLVNSKLRVMLVINQLIMKLGELAAPFQYLHRWNWLLYPGYSQHYLSHCSTIVVRFFLCMFILEMFKMKEEIKKVMKKLTLLENFFELLIDILVSIFLILNFVKLIATRT